MRPTLIAIMDEVATTLSGLPGAYSTAQWGGRAWKVPGPGGNTKKGKLLAFVTTDREQTAVQVMFKLERVRAQAMVDKYAWIEPHQFRTLGPAGWLSARLTQKRQLGPLKKLLTEAREGLPKVEPTPESERPGRTESPRRAAGASETARHIDRVMQETAGELGWTPGREDF